MNGLAVKFVGCAAATEADAPEPEEVSTARAEHVARCVKCQALRLTIGVILRYAGMQNRKAERD